MNDEIKEILDNFEKYEARYKLHNETQFIITYREIQILLDYITNLQTIEKLYDNKLSENKLLKQELTNLQQGNERLKELKDTYKEQCRITHNDLETYIRKYECLQEENRGIRKAFIGLQKELNEDYKSRCEKAIEYINEKKHLSMFADCRESEEDWSYDLECSANDLLNILQNGDNND